MSQHLTRGEIRNYAERTLPPDVLLTADEHLGSCDECAALLGGHLPANSVDRMLFDPVDDDPSSGHLSYEQFEGYVDGDINDADLEIVELHRETCGDCAEQLNELIQIRATLDLGSETPEFAVNSGPALSLWEKISVSPLFRFGAPAFAAALIGVTAWSIGLFDRPSPAEVSSVDQSETRIEVVGADSDTVAANSDPAAVGNLDSSPSAPLVSLADGPDVIEIDANGNLKGLRAPQFEARLKAALTTQNIEISTAARELRSKSGVLMSDTRPGVPFALTSPVGKVIESARPQFRWKAMENAESYVVSVFDAGFNKVAESPPLKQNSWISSTLKRGNVYQWQVTARKDGEEIKSPARPAPDARFRVIDSIAASEIDTAKRNFGNSRLLLGILYANAGLLDDAEREFQALLRKNPNSEAARRLLNKVRSAK